MLEVTYEKLIPYPFDVVLSQYFDYEHIAHVHPTTLGEYRLVERAGNRIVYDQIWPAGLFGRRRVSRVAQEFFPPNRTTFEFMAGRHRGTRVETTLTQAPSDEAGDGTLVREIYHVPGLPNWAWLRPLVRPFMVRVIERVWDEDLGVEVCYGGWPGIPGREVAPAEGIGVTPGGTIHDIGKAAEFPAGCARSIQVDGAEVAVFAHDGQRFALGNRCPHTGGPLSLGKIEGGAVVCPWHGARFDLKTGRALCGPVSESVPAFDVAEVEGRLSLRTPAPVPGNPT